jgi:hypothetical protein
MNVYLKAAIDTVLFVVYILAIYFGVTYLLNTYGDAGIYTFAGVLTGFCLYLVYSISLARRRYQASKAAK